MNEKSMPQGVLVYDSQCNLCLATKAWFEKRDSSGKVGFVSARDPGLISEFPQLQGLDLLGEITWIDQRGQLYRGADAIAKALQHMPGWRWAASPMMLPGTRTVRHIAYRWIAKHRYRWFGRVAGIWRLDPRAPGISRSRATHWGFGEQQHREALTDFVRQVRLMLQEVIQKRVIP